MRQQIGLFEAFWAALLGQLCCTCLSFHRPDPKESFSDCYTASWSSTGLDKHKICAVMLVVTDTAGNAAESSNQAVVAWHMQLDPQLPHPTLYAVNPNRGRACHSEHAARHTACKGCW